jgi:hypothetical protein
LKIATPLNFRALIEEANASEHKEAYRLLEKKEAFRIGIGVRVLPSSDIPSFFVEIIVNLCPGLNKVDLQILEKALSCIKALQARAYSLTCQDSHHISCEKNLSEQNLTAEYEIVKSLMTQTFM